MSAYRLSSDPKYMAYFISAPVILNAIIGMSTRYFLYVQRLSIPAFFPVLSYRKLFLHIPSTSQTVVSRMTFSLAQDPFVLLFLLALIPLFLFLKDFLLASVLLQLHLLMFLLQRAMDITV